MKSKPKELTGDQLTSKKADLKGVSELTFDQLSKVKTLYEAKLDDELRIPLKKNYPDL